MFSKSCEYGIKAIFFIAQKSQWGERVGLKEIAVAIDSPTAFTAKILQVLAKAGIIISTKGSLGGYHIEKKQLPKINLRQVVEAIDGNRIFEGCALGLSSCNADEPCPMHEQFAAIRSELGKTLASSNLLDVAMDLNLGLSVLKRQR